MIRRSDLYVVSAVWFAMFAGSGEFALAIACAGFGAASYHCERMRQ